MVAFRTTNTSFTTFMVTLRVMPRTKNQPYIQTNKISLQDVEALMKILEATFGNHNEVRIASGKLDCIMQGNCKFSIYYAKFQCLMAILDDDCKVKKVLSTNSYSSSSS
jgi:hypothetical protein